MQMNDTYQQAIDGTLRSQTSAGTGNPLTFYNDTAIALNMYLISGTGEHYGYDSQAQNFAPGAPPYQVAPNGGSSLTQANPEAHWFWLFTNAYSGAFAAVFETPSSGNIGITSFDLLEPNDIGHVPRPDQDVIIPSDSTPVVVGCGAVGTEGSAVVREQYWQRLSDSYSIGPGERKTVNNTVTSGMQETTSELASVEGSLSASARAGWGPVSASVSASLSAASTTFQQVTTTKQTTSYVSDRYENAAGNPAFLHLYWQLTDSVTVYDRSGNPLSSIVTGTQPVVIGGPYAIPTFAP
ncbi:hypothetical protein ACFVFS_20130 [Kitasatospora sp. NPDC057692]|uniref:hypothetical protein n=1 Tax=Kitasatospora sp. NPDC057692 TaxID=3346215 RepID=UPI0036C83FE1